MVKLYVDYKCAPLFPFWNVSPLIFECGRSEQTLFPFTWVKQHKLKNVELQVSCTREVVFQTYVWLVSIVCWVISVKRWFFTCYTLSVIDGSCQLAPLEHYTPPSWGHKWTRNNKQIAPERLWINEYLITLQASPYFSTSPPDPTPKNYNNNELISILSFSGFVMSPPSTSSIWWSVMMRDPLTHKAFLRTDSFLHLANILIPTWINTFLLL